MLIGSLPLLTSCCENNC